MLKKKEKNKKVIDAAYSRNEDEKKFNYSIFLWMDSEPIDIGEFYYQEVLDSNEEDKICISYQSEVDFLLEGTTKETVNLTYDRNTFRPLLLDCSFENINKKVELCAKYEKKKIIMDVWDDGIKNKWVDRIPYTVIDNYQSLIAMRHLNFDKFEGSSFSLVNALTFSISEVECMLSGVETVTTGIGDFECYRLCLEVYDPMPFTQYNLYSVEPPHQMIKVIKGPLVFELKSIV